MMMATANERRHLHERLVGALGEEAAATLIEVLAQTATRDDLAPLATRRDLDELEARIDARFDREGRRVAEALAGVRVEIAEGLASGRVEIASAREDAAVHFGLIRHDIAAQTASRRMIALTVATTITALFAAAVAVASLAAG
jgi:hypothetical protein